MRYLDLKGILNIVHWTLVGIPTNIGRKVREGLELL